MARRARLASRDPGLVLADGRAGTASPRPGTPHEAPRPEGLAVTLALRRLPASGKRSCSLPARTSAPDLAATAMRVSLATLRRRLAEARSALRAALPSNL
jgi:hypothetical protein